MGAQATEPAEEHALSAVEELKMLIEEEFAKSRFFGSYYQVEICGVADTYRYGSPPEPDKVALVVSKTRVPRADEGGAFRKFVVAAICDPATGRLTIFGTSGQTEAVRSLAEYSEWAQRIATIVHTDFVNEVKYYDAEA